MLTPPVAVASYVAASLAGADMWRTSVVAIRLTASAYLLPFLWVFNPALLLDGPWSSVVLVTRTAVVAGWVADAKGKARAFRGRDGRGKRYVVGGSAVVVGFGAERLGSQRSALEAPKVEIGAQPAQRVLCDAEPPVVVRAEDAVEAVSKPEREVDVTAVLVVSALAALLTGVAFWVLQPPSLSFCGLENSQRVDRGAGAVSDRKRRRHEQKCPPLAIPRFSRDGLETEVVEQRHAHGVNR